MIMMTMIMMMMMMMIIIIIIIRGTVAQNWGPLIHFTESVSVRMIFQTCIWEVRGSKIGYVIACSNWCLLFFLHSPLDRVSL
jgi:hypothetical protein